MTIRRLVCVASGLALLSMGGSNVHVLAPAPLRAAQAPAPVDQAFLARYCTRCHNDRLSSGGLELSSPDLSNVGTHGDVWEKVVRKLRARAMPPSGSPRPDEPAYQQFIAGLEAELDRAAAARPDPGRIEPLRRLSRTEYRNAVRDLLAVEVDVADLLPPDDASFGFDNVSVTSLSPTLMERYLAAAQKISRLAIGAPVRAASSRTVVLPPDLTQETHLDGMPFGTRGGTLATHVFPMNGDYVLRVRLARNRNENVEGLTEAHQIEVTLDGARLQLFTVTPNRNRFGDYYSDEGVDAHLEVRVPVTAGPHAVGAAFVAKTAALIETERQPYDAHFNADRHPRTQPAVRSISIEGPFDASGAGDTPSRRQIFSCRPKSASPADEDACAKTIITALARRAYRRSVTDADLDAPMKFFRAARDAARASSSAAGAATATPFENGIEMAVRALLASTEFLFRIERDPRGVAPGAPYRVDEIALASRLSFFLWSTAPDDALMGAASQRGLGTPAARAQQVRRLLSDPRAESLTTSFANQWLHLRNLAAVRPDLRQFPDFDDNLRQAFRRETELLFESVVREDRPITELLTANYTFLNERLARHYGIAGVTGDHFRKVSMAGHPERVGILAHGSVLTVTSYATRTSPVLRGKWVLDNLLGLPPPPPPPNVPPLPDRQAGARPLSMRERMSEHRTNAVCASCHQLMDPAGLALENFDAIGRWRTRDGDAAIDASGNIPGAATFEGVAGLRSALIAHPDVFATTLTEKLMTYALGRGVDYRDAPAVRAIVRAAAARDYRFSALIEGIVESVPFQMRRAAGSAAAN